MTPLMFVMLWSSFLMMSNQVYKLFLLLLFSISLPLLYIDQFSSYWPCVLILILMSTGLMVVFAYITSLDQSKSSSIKIWQFGMIVASSLLMAMIYEPNLYFSLHYFPHFSSFSGSVSVSIFLVNLLLLFVVLFIRLTYSKGGGFRKIF